MDDVLFAQAVLSDLGEEPNQTLERTPSGGLHLWGRGVPARDPVERVMLGRGACRVLYEGKDNHNWRTPGRVLLNWEPLSQMGLFPSYLLPGQGRDRPEVKLPIREGNRWNTLYEQINSNCGLDETTLRFQARYLCDPALENDKVKDLLKILDKTLRTREVQSLSESEEGESHLRNRKT